MADAAHKGRKLTVETSIQDQILYTRTYLESETFQLILFFEVKIFFKQACRSGGW
jgi:hypothetical protein